MINPSRLSLLQYVLSVVLVAAWLAFTLLSMRRRSNRRGAFQVMCHQKGRSTVVSAGMLMVALAGCSPRYNDMPVYWPIPTREYDNYGPGRFKTSYLAEQIDRHYRGSAPGPIGVTTFVNIDDLYTTSTFGRMVAEQLMSELTMKGFDVIELRHTDALQFLDSSGEFALSRDVRAVRPERNLAAVVVGTYVNSPSRVYLNARLIDPSTSLVVSAGSVEMTKTRELAKLLRGGTLPASLERIPVRHLGAATYPINPFDPIRKRWDMEESADWRAPSLAPRELLPAPSRPLKLAPQRLKSREPVIDNGLEPAVADSVAKDSDSASKVVDGGTMDEKAGGS